MLHQYLTELRINTGITGIFNMTGNVNLQDFTSFHIIFDFRFQKSSDFTDFSVGVYEIWQQLVTLNSDANL